MNEDQKNINGKLKSLCERFQALDWTPDKDYTRPGPKGIPQTIYYTSLKKIKKNVMPVYADLGLDIKINIVSVTTDGGRVQFTCDIVLTDLDSGEHDVTRIISASPTMDKGEAIALSNAQRMYYSSRYGIEGLEFEEEDGEPNVNGILSAKAIPVPAPAVSAPATQHVPTADVPASNVSATAVPQAKPSQAEQPKVSPPPAKPVQTKLSMVEAQTRVKSMEIIERLKDNISEEDYATAKSVFENCSTSKDISILLDIKHKAESKVKPAREGM